MVVATAWIAVEACRYLLSAVRGTYEVSEEGLLYPMAIRPHLQWDAVRSIDTRTETEPSATVQIVIELADGRSRVHRVPASSVPIEDFAQAILRYAPRHVTIGPALQASANPDAC